MKKGNAVLFPFFKERNSQNSLSIRERFDAKHMGLCFASAIISLIVLIVKN